MYLPAVSQQVDYEAELAVVIGRRAKHVTRERAYDYVLGYTNLNDVSARDLQFADKQWQRGKSCDTFAPMGPAIVTADEVADPARAAHPPAPERRDDAGFLDGAADLRRRPARGVPDARP